VHIASVEEIRGHFPALERVHAGHPVAYFDGPGGTQVPKDVVAAMEGYLTRHNANTGWAYPTSLETDEALEAARATFAAFLGCRPTEIVFGANMTTLAFHVARAIGRQLRQRDEIVVTELDHLANVAPWEALAVERGLTVRTVPLVPDDGTLDWDALEAAVTSATRLVAVGAASNALGTINDVPRAAAIARSAGALLFVDAVHLAPHELIDVAEMECDFLACSAYKVYGPHVGVLFARERLLQELDVPRLRCAPDTAPERLETGTLNFEGVVGASAAVDFLASLATGETERDRLRTVFSALRERGATFVRQLWDGLGAISGVRRYGPPLEHPRTPTVAFTVEGLPSGKVAAQLADRWAAFLSHGDFYASAVVERYGKANEGFVRAGCACYTTAEEVERLLTGVEELATA
jgi:cysteine desulfurase family protein (TIGR01976 family)